MTAPVDRSGRQAGETEGFDPKGESAVPVGQAPNPQQPLTGEEEIARALCRADGGFWPERDRLEDRERRGRWFRLADALLTGPLAAMDETIRRLRSIIADCAEALGNGAYVRGASDNFLAEVPSEVKGVVTDLRARAQAAEAERDDLRSYAHALQVALTWFAGGGSENFVRHGDEFRADIEFCRNKIQDRLTRASNRFREAVRDCKAAEAERDEAVRKLGEAQDALRKAEAQSAEHKATASDLAGALEQIVAWGPENQVGRNTQYMGVDQSMSLLARAALARSRKPENKGGPDV